LATVEEALALLKPLEDELRQRQPDIDRLTGYYEGRQSLKFASAEFREWFSKQYEGFVDNWCAPVADATTERLKFTGIRPRGQRKTDEDLRRWWEENSGPAESSMAFSVAAQTARAFALVWGTDDGPELTFEHPSQAIVAYQAGSRRKRKAALKMWRDGGKDMATLYTPDEVWKFERQSLDAGSALHLPASALTNGGWQQRQPSEDSSWPLPNPLGVVPMVELQNRPKLKGAPLSEIAGVASMQDAINALWAYLFTSADFAALPQRVILGAQLPKMPILNDQGVKVGEKPIDLPEANVKRILNLEGPNAKIDQWESAKLDIFTGVIEKMVSHVGNQTRTPLHYFASAIQNISGDTLKALETGLDAKISDRKVYHDDPVREINRLMALAAGDEAKAAAVAAGTVVWTDHESRSVAQKVDGLQKLGDLGFPLQYLVEQYVGGDADEVERIMDMVRDSAELEPLNALARRERREPNAGAGDE
jgi:hypothetical protein